MKTSATIASLLIAGFFLLSSQAFQESSKATGSIYPATVKKVIDDKCYGCHSIKGKSQDAKDALMWDSLPGLPKNKIIATLDDIIEVLDEDKMPPEKFVQKFPEAALLSAEKAMLKSWAEVKADSLLK